MSYHVLVPHPSQPLSARPHLRATAGRTTDGGLLLDYRLNVPDGRIRLPSSSPVRRLDGLWRHTCFEAFIAAPGTSSYREFNLSPSGDWQAYDFTRYRQGCPLEPATEPALDCRTDAEGLRLTATIPAIDLYPKTTWRLGLSAVLEDTDGNLSYWALVHPSAKPDFHHPDSFTLELPCHESEPTP